MNKKVLVQFLMTLGLFVVLLVAAGLVLAFMPKDEDTTDIDLAMYYKRQRAEVLERIKGCEFASVKEYIHDDGSTAAVNKLLHEQRLIHFPESVDWIARDKLVVKSNTIIKFDRGCKLRVQYPDVVSPLEQCLFLLQNVRNVTILGNFTTIMGIQAASAPEGFSAFCIYGSQDIRIFDLAVDSPTRYGFVVSGSPSRPASASERVDLLNVHTSLVRKVGLLVESVRGLRVYDFSASETLGLSPQGAILLKPQRNSDVLQQIRMDTVSTVRNGGVGLAIVPGVEMAEELDVEVSNFTSDEDGELAPIYFMNSAKGKVKVSLLDLQHKSRLGALFRTWSSSQCHTTIVRGSFAQGLPFPYVIADKNGDPFSSNLDQLEIV